MLLDDYAHTCTILVPVRTESDEGGWKTSYEDGDQFENHQALDTSTEALRAEKEGVASLYSGLIDQGVELNYGDYFRDETTGITYRVTSIPDEKMSPASASFSYKYFLAERKEAPT